jgi:hypothetical protein
MQNMNEAVGYFIKVNEPGTKWQLLPDFTFMWNLKEMNF